MCVRSFLDDGVNLKIKLNMFEKKYVFFGLLIKNHPEFVLLLLFTPK